MGRAALPEGYACAMRRHPCYAWWKPAIAGAIAVAAYLVARGLAAAMCGVLAGVSDVGAAGDAFAAAGAGGLGDPLALALGFLAVAVLLPGLGIPLRSLGMGGLGALSSVVGRLRWDAIRAFAPWALLVAAVFEAVWLAGGYAVCGAGEAPGGVRFLPVSAAVVVLLVPLQCAAEEYFFRGWLLQALCAWGFPVSASIAVQAAVFGAWHVGYGAFGAASAAVLGLALGIVAVKTGGLEGAVCIHAANNAVSLLAGCFFSGAVPGASATLMSFLFGGAAASAAFAAVVIWVARRRGFVLKA